MSKILLHFTLKPVSRIINRRNVWPRVKCYHIQWHWIQCTVHRIYHTQFYRHIKCIITKQSSTVTGIQNQMMQFKQSYHSDCFIDNDVSDVRHVIKHRYLTTRSKCRRQLNTNGCHNKQGLYARNKPPYFLITKKSKIKVNIIP